MKTNFKIGFLVLGVIVSFSYCKRDMEALPANHQSKRENVNNLSIRIENYVDTLPLQLNITNYVNPNNDTFKVSLFKYYISNIQLKASDSSVYAETESYHLLNAGDPNSLEFVLPDVPMKNYVSLSFLIGVDSLRNVSGVQTGALDVTNAMFWDWNTGYIMAKFEGNSPQSAAAGDNLIYHVGGFSGAENVIKKVKLNLIQAATVTAAVSPKIILKADLMEWFKSPFTLSFSSLSVVHAPGSNAMKVADNYADMFSVRQVKN